MHDRKPIAEGLWSDGPEPCLIAGRRHYDGLLVFPIPEGAAVGDYDPVALPQRGTLWSWTIQSFPPKSPPYAGPADFVPFAVGYVQLGDTLIVEGRLTRLENLEIGMDMQLEIVPFDDGHLTYAFAPAVRS
jgi:uncharacterized OB-fold protein